MSFDRGENDEYNLDRSWTHRSSNMLSRLLLRPWSAGSRQEPDSPQFTALFISEAGPPTRTGADDEPKPGPSPPAHLEREGERSAQKPSDRGKGQGSGQGSDGACCVCCGTSRPMHVMARCGHATTCVQCAKGLEEMGAACPACANADVAATVRGAGLPPMVVTYWDVARKSRGEGEPSVESEGSVAGGGDGEEGGSSGAQLRHDRGAYLHLLQQPQAPSDFSPPTHARVKDMSTAAGRSPRAPTAERSEGRLQALDEIMQEGRAMAAAQGELPSVRHMTPDERRRALKEIETQGFC